MTRIIIVFITILQASNLFSQCPCQNKTIKERVLILKSYVDKKDEVTEKKFFDAFPCTFKEMQRFFGYDDTKGATPLYFSGEPILETFKNLRNIPKEQYYKKYIGICINGKFHADHIYGGFGMANRMNNDTKVIIPILSKYSDKEINSVFRFIFDGPHTDNEYNKNTYEELYPTIKSISPRVAELMKQAYEQLLSEDDGHGR